MTRPRSTVVSPTDTLYYHCMGRCVRRSYLCGKDPLSGRNFDHRKQIIQKRLALLTDTFSIDLCAYALMSNHYHLVVRLMPEQAALWSPREVAERWRRIYSGPPFLERFIAGAEMTSSERSILEDRVPIWRQRLSDLSWFMRSLNEFIARIANAEDECTGRFWEGRFKSQALLDERALLTVMTYVDLNPIRAGLADSIEASVFTSGQQRVHAAITMPTKQRAAILPSLAPFQRDGHAAPERELPFSLHDYLELLDTSGRHVHPEKRGSIPMITSPLLASLGVDRGEWLKSMMDLHTRFWLFIGTSRRLRTLAEARGWRWVRGHGSARRLFGCANE